MKINSSNGQTNITSSQKKIVAVIIPIYKEKLSDSEKLSLERCKAVLKNYPKFLVAPKNLNINHYLKVDNSLNVVSFDNKYFNGFEGYNKLMLSKFFYERFAEYNYILIHQLDVFIFKDELTEWCDKNYDYIGAPWYRDSIKIFINIAKKNSFLRAIKLIIKKKLNYHSGNGGLSLRKVQSFIECLELEKKLINNWKRLNEDLFWSFFSRNYQGDFNRFSTFRYRNYSCFIRFIFH